jgi:hypothetical protein
VKKRRKAARSSRLFGSKGRVLIALTACIGGWKTEELIGDQLQLRWQLKFVIQSFSNKVPFFEFEARSMIAPVKSCLGCYGSEMFL